MNLNKLHIFKRLNTLEHENQELRNIISNLNAKVENMDLKFLLKLLKNKINK